MLDLAEVFSWLNINDRSKLSAEELLSIREIYDPQVPQSQKDGALKMLRMNAESSLNESERAELTASLGVYYFQKGQFPEAVSYFNESEKIYQHEPHCRGIVNWMRGSVYWKTHDNMKAHANWRLTIFDFDLLRDQFLSEKASTKVNWYDETIEKMRIETAQTAEEAFDWFYKWDRSALNDRSIMLVKEIEERIKNNDYPSAYELGKGLSKISRFQTNPIESAETTVILGMNYHRMGQAKLAIDHFRGAEVSAMPDDYRQAVIKWMLGAAQWDLHYEKENAIRSWGEAINMFYEVMAQSDRKNDQMKRSWLDKQIITMQKALDMKTKELLSTIY
jgi:tetratricopeptide (TPR) repeat protein